MSHIIRNIPTAHDFRKSSEHVPEDACSNSNHEPTKTPVKKVEPIVDSEIVRCCECKRKLGLLPHECKCGKLTCAKHRWPDHPCDFDFASRGRKIIAERNKKIVAEKLSQI